MNTLFFHQTPCLSDGVLRVQRRIRLHHFNRPAENAAGLVDVHYRQVKGAFPVGGTFGGAGAKVQQQPQPQRRGILVRRPARSTAIQGNGTHNKGANQQGKGKLRRD